MKKINTWFARYSSVVIVLLLIFTASGVAAGVYCTVEQSVSVAEAAVGEAYRQDESLAEKMLFYITASNVSEDNLERFCMAVEEYGYTKDAFNKAVRARMPGANVWFVVSAVLALVLSMVVLMHQRYVKKHIDDERQGILEVAKKAQNIEAAYMEKRKGSIQNYLENVAHQTRTPLTNVMLGMDSIYDEQTVENKKVLDECYYHIERVNKLMARFLKMGKLEAGEVVFEKQSESLKQLIQDVVSRLADKDRVNATLEDVVVSMDAQWMYEAFACIIENCLENSLSDGSTANVDVILCREDDMAVITVRDYGKGFDDEDVEHIFERFYSNDKRKATGHYGIGLNLAKLIIEAHYGVIKAGNAKGGGAMFRIVFPKLILKDGKMSP